MSSVCVGIWSGTGSRHERPHQSGISHFIEHMLFKGTSSRSAREISESIESLGGYLNAFTSEENTCYYARASARHFKQLSHVLMDMYLNPTFPAEEFLKEREVIGEELSMYLDQPHHRVQELLNEVCWPKHALGRCITGTHSSLKALSVGKLRNFWRQHYVGQNTLITVAGPIEHQHSIRCIRPLAAKLAPGSVPIEAPIKDNQNKPARALIKRAGEQVQLALGIKTGSRNDPKQHALRVLNALLGENMSSRLFQLLREDHGMVYSIYSSQSFFNDVGLLNISAGMEASNVEKGLQLIRKTLESLTLELPDRKEVRQACDYLAGQLDLHLENTENHMTWLGEHILGYGQLPDVDQLLKSLKSVTPSLIRETVRELAQPQNLNLAAVGPANIRQIKDFDNWMA
jgi:predicted Zn-dependent peptidase